MSTQAGNCSNRPPLVEVEFGSVAAMPPCSIKINGVEFRDYVRTLRINCSRGDVVVVGLDIQCRLKLKTLALLDPNWIVEPETERPGGYAGAEQE